MTAIPNPKSPSPHRVRRGFTLVEMVVVIAIVLTLLGMLLPGASRMWEERKLADTENIIQGMVMTSRASALSAGGVQTGMLFYVDELGVQQIRSITQSPQEAGDVHLANVFTINEDRAYHLPAPVRVVPRYAVVQSVASNEFFAFSEEELANNLMLPASGSHPSQRHRNFFTIVYGGDGKLLVGRDVLIQDADNDEDDIGDVTGLPIGHDASNDTGTISKYYQQTVIAPGPIDPTALARTVDYVVYDTDEDAAFNFPSVDGLLVYDDSLFRSLEDGADQRTYLLETAQPLYIHPVTGSMIRGPIGEALP